MEAAQRKAQEFCTRSGTFAMRGQSWRWVALLCSLWFVFCGVLWVNEIGIQTDEALLAAGVYGPFTPNYVIRVASIRLPMMTMPYVGTVKSWLYRPILAIWGPSPATLRIPAVIIGALTVWLFACLLRRGADSTAAVFGAVLLASDPMYLLTIRWDWGPVAIQHLCLIGALLLFMRFHGSQNAALLCAGFALLGVGLWDKATFAWLLAAVCVAAVSVFPGVLLGYLSKRNAALACISFLLGAAPLLVFNIREHWTTFRSTAHFSAGDINGKASLLKETLQGAALYGSIVREDSDGPPRPGQSTLQRSLVSFNALAKKPRASLQFALFLASLGGLPFVWNTRLRRPAVFALLFLFVGWCMMAFTKDAGGSVHHVVLLWPMPQFFMATVLSGLISLPIGILRSAAILSCTVVCVSNSLVTTTYYAHQIQNGGNWAWTDAFYSLSDTLAATNARRLCLLDWGFWENLRFMHQGRLVLQAPGQPVTEEEQKSLLSIFADTSTTFVSHTEGNEGFPGRAHAILEFAALNGYRKHNVEVFQDRNGRAVIEIFGLELNPRADRL